MAFFDPNGFFADAFNLVDAMRNKKERRAMRIDQFTNPFLAFLLEQEVAY